MKIFTKNAKTQNPLGGGILRLKNKISKIANKNSKINCAKTRNEVFSKSQNGKKVSREKSQKSGKRFLGFARNDSLVLRGKSQKSAKKFQFAKLTFAKISAVSIFIFALSFATWLNFAQNNSQNANAATTITAISLINSGEMSAQVFWPADADGKVEDRVVAPEKYEISLKPKSAISVGTVIDFGRLTVTGKISAAFAASSSQETLGNLGAFDGRFLTLSRDLAAGAESNITIKPVFSSTAHLLTASTDLSYTETFLNSSISREIPAVNVDAATSFNTNLCGDSPFSRVGSVSVGIMRYDQQYSQSVLDGAPDNSRLPSGNYVAVWQIDAENAQKVVDVDINIAADYLQAITPDGKNLASTTTSPNPYRTYVESGRSHISEFTETNIAGGANSAENVANLLANSAPKTWGWARNADGSITAYMNFGNFADYAAPTESFVNNAVLNQPWAGTTAGAKYANEMWKNGVGVGSALIYRLSFFLADPTVATIFAGNVQTSEGCNRTQTRSSQVSSAVVEGQTAIKIQYLAKNGAPLATTTTAYGWPNDEFITPAAPQIAGYTFVANAKTDDGISGASAGAKVNFPAQNQTLLTYVYAPNDENFAVNFVDENGKILAPQEKITGKFGENWEVFAKKIKGFAVAKNPAQTSGTFTENNADLTFVYKNAANLKDDEKSTEFEKSVAIIQLKNDEIFGEIAEIQISAPKNGKAILNDENQIIYTPNADFYGEDNFIYTVILADGAQFSANVKIVVATPKCPWNSEILIDDENCKKPAPPKIEDENAQNSDENSAKIIPTAPATGIFFAQNIFRKI